MIVKYGNGVEFLRKSSFSVTPGQLRLTFAVFKILKASTKT